MKNNKSEVKWINFLHIYQPANADDEKINEATEKSYLRIIRGLEEHPDIKFTFNITGCLVLRWIETENTDVIVRIKNLIKKGQIELTGSAAYHALLPLIDKREVEKQIRENEEILLKNFGVKPKGFFFPEMAYGDEVAKIVKKMGYEWTILDEISSTGKLGKTVGLSRALHTSSFGHLRSANSGQTSSSNAMASKQERRKVVIDKNSDLKVVLRSRKYSNSYVPKTINKLEGSEEDVITGTDGELVGLRHEDPTGEFEKVLKKKNIITLTISEYIKTKKDIEKIRIYNSNWESTEKDLWKMQPYALWENSGNGIQKRIWKLAKIAYKTVEGNVNDDNYAWARWHLVRGLASCTFWWASGKDFSYIYGPNAWNPDEIERGLRELIRSIRSLDDITTRKVKMDSEKLYVRIKQMIWNKHWDKHWKR